MKLETSHPDRPVEAIVLAAGKGTRMGGDRAKVLYEVAGRAMVHWVIDACEAAGARRCVVVIGHEADKVRRELAGRKCCTFVEQTEQLGTGHAVRTAEPAFAADRDVDVFVLCGDGPLIRSQTLTTLLQTHRARSAAATLATSIMDQPFGFGRIIRDAGGELERIVEEKDATEAQRAIREVNPSYYCFHAASVFEALRHVGNDNAKGEFYLTDVIEVLRRQGSTVSVVDAVPQHDVLSINTPQQLAEVERILLQRQGGGGTTGRPSRIGQEAIR